MNQFFICYREVDYQYFLFNGEWPVGITPGGEDFGTILSSEKTMNGAISATNLYIDLLKEVLNSKKKVFTINKLRFIVTYRAQFVNE